MPWSHGLQTYSGRMRPIRAWTAAVAATFLLLGACGQGDPGSAPSLTQPSPGHTRSGEVAPEREHESGHVDDHSADYARPIESRPLRKEERRLTLSMPEAYTPSAPTGVGADDYRCFLLDPGLKKDVFITGNTVVPGNPKVVHHVILFHVPPDQIAAAKRADGAVDGPGWTCFGGTGTGERAGLDDAPWLGAWAPGGAESVMRRGYGVELPKGSQIIMQVHYSLLAGSAEDVSSIQLRLAPKSADLTPVRTMLLPAPVELPCRPGHRDGPLCDRDAALADVKARFGQGPGSTADLLHLLCGGKPRAGKVQTCTRTIGEPTTILGAAGHMHLLGSAIKIEVNAGTEKERTVLDIDVWDFDNQAAEAVDPIRLEPFDTVTVTCRHSQRVRDLLPAFEQQRQDRYVLWGDGTTDEMCLGILQVVDAET